MMEDKWSKCEGTGSYYAYHDGRMDYSLTLCEVCTERNQLSQSKARIKELESIKDKPKENENG